MNEPTIEKLHVMRLVAMATAWMTQHKDAQIGSLSFDERFALLVDAEYVARDNRRLTRLLKDAALRIPSACVEDVKTSAQRGIDKSLLRQLATCTWIVEHLNVLITGPTGVGKSYLASALGQAACRSGKRVAYRRVPRLFDELALARAEGTYARTLARLAKAEVLVLDDLGLGVVAEVDATKPRRPLRGASTRRRRVVAHGPLRTWRSGVRSRLATTATAPSRTKSGDEACETFTPTSGPCGSNDSVSKRVEREPM
jgi:hypothetical protein